MPRLMTSPAVELRDLDWITTTVQRLVLWLEPAGGQSVARRNAWACMVEDTQRRAHRADVERSLQASVRSSERVGRRTAIG